MFTNKGEVNASSFKEALQALVKYAAILKRMFHANQGLAGQPSLSDDKRDELITRAIMTQDGKIALAQAMANPIRRNLDYHGIARRALVVDPLPQGAMPTYDRDIDVAAVVISTTVPDQSPEYSVIESSFQSLKSTLTQRLESLKSSVVDSTLLTELFRRLVKKSWLKKMQTSSQLLTQLLLLKTL